MSTKTKMSFTVVLDSDAVNPDSIKAAFTTAIETLEIRAERLTTGAIALDWNTFEFAMSKLPHGDTALVVRAVSL